MSIKGRGMRRVLALAAVLLPAPGLAGEGVGERATFPEAAPPNAPAARLPGEVAPQQAHPLLVTEDWLAERLDDPGLLLLNVEYDESTFLEGHIRGARFLPYQEIVTQVGELLVELPPQEQLVEVFRQAGISNDLHVVLYGTPIPAARAFVTLEHLGHDRLSVLDGGLYAWEEAGRAVATGEVTGERGTFRPALREDVFVDANWVDERRDDAGYALLDGRPDNEYTGADNGRNGTYRPGHIPGAGHVYWEEFILSREEPRFVSRDEMLALFGRAGIDPGETVISYCYIGMRASVNYFVSRLLGYQTRFYDGSWNDWSLQGLPAETGPQPPPR